MRAYCPPPLSTQQTHSSFLFLFNPGQTVGGLFKENLPPNYFERGVEYVEKPEEAEVILLPNNFTYLDQGAQEYIKKYADLAEQLQKPIYIFSCGDLSDRLVFDSRALVFKYSIYKSQQRSNEISAPTLTEDIGRTGIALRQKNELAVVSFCGKAGFASTREWFATFVRRIKYTLQSSSNPLTRARIRGVYWRLWMLKACEGSPLIKTLFIVRKTFSGAARTIELPPAQAREEFISSIRESDFVLAAKGDGNYSNRFLEALAMGRIPVVVDTDIALPFADQIAYEKIMVRVPMSKVAQTPRYIKEWYDSLSSQEWVARQQLARDTFEKYLRQDKFFEVYFSNL